MSGIVSTLKNRLFRLGYCFRGAPARIDGTLFRIDESLRRWNVNSEQEVRETYKRILSEGDVGIDVGANFGLHALVMASLVREKGHIFAFEPIPSNVKLLKRNVALNSFEKYITVVESALSNNVDMPTVEMNISADHGDVAVAATIDIGSPPDVGTLLTVPNDTLDSFVRKMDIAPKFIKIDVEGAEFEVLKGAKATLETYKPYLLVEVHSFALYKFKSSWDELDNFLRSLGYLSHRLSDTVGAEGQYFHAFYSFSQP